MESRFALLDEALGLLVVVTARFARRCLVPNRITLSLVAACWRRWITIHLGAYPKLYVGIVHVR